MSILENLLIFGESGTVILKKIETPAIKKTFDEIAEPLQQAAKQAGLTRADVKKLLKTSEICLNWFLIPIFSFLLGR